jgi:hypothetical protein
MFLKILCACFLGLRPVTSQCYHLI